MKLVSVPEMNYQAKDLKGEIWCRGPGVFAGYYKDEAKTKEALTDDGWLKTGDIGSLDKHGRLSIIDRKKNIFKLAQGEYVAPEKLENTFVKSGFVAQIYVHGDSLQSELVGIVVPDAEYSVNWAISKGVLPPNTPVPASPQPGQPTPPIMFELCKKEAFKQAILADLQVFAKEDKLRGFEYVKAIALEPNSFSVDNGLLTPTFKLKRHDAAVSFLFSTFRKCTARSLMACTSRSKRVPRIPRPSCKSFYQTDIFMSILGWLL
jgi:long-chain acyl-CoA synthetase